MTTVSEPNASVLDKDERAVLFGAFLNIDDQRLDIERFRIKHKKLIPVIDRLIERKFIAAEGAFYRVTLDGLYALNNDATRVVIETFNAILPVLVSLYEKEGSRKQWALRDLVECAARWPNLMVNERLLGRALWHLLPHLPIAGGWTRTESAEIASFTLVEAVLNFPELPLEKALTVAEIRDDSFGRFLRAVQFEDSRLGIGRWIELSSVTATANIRPEIARGCLARLSRDGLCRQRDGEKFLIDRDTVTEALTKLAWTTSGDLAETIEPASTPAPAGLGMRTTHDLEVVNALARISEDLAACYRQALRDLAQEDRESFVGPAAALRELLSVVLRELAPDDVVMAKPGFKPETNDGRPSRAQRVRYIGTTRGRDVERALEGVDRIVCVTYDRASKATHLGPTGRTEIATLVNYVHGILRDLLLG